MNKRMNKWKNGWEKEQKMKEMKEWKNKKWMTEWMNERMIRWKDEWMDGPLLVSNTNNNLIKMYESYSIMFILTTGQFLWQNGHVVVLTLALPRVNNLKNTVLLFLSISYLKGVRTISLKR